jgi:LEA14-like dessication related protein
MKKNIINYVIGGGIVIAIASVILKKSTAIKNLNVNVTKIDFNKKDKTFVVFVRIINPSNASIKIDSIVGDVIWKGTYGATMDYRVPTTIDATGEKTIQIPVKMNLEFVTLLGDLIKQKAEFLNGIFEIKGVINAERMVFPFTYKKEIKLI